MKHARKDFGREPAKLGTAPKRLGGKIGRRRQDGWERSTVRTVDDIRGNLGHTIHATSCQAAPAPRYVSPALVIT